MDRQAQHDTPEINFFANRQISRDYVAPNLLLAGIDAKSVTVGATRRLSNGSELIVSAEDNHGGRHDGTGPSQGSPINTHFYTVTMGWGHRF